MPLVTLIEQESELASIVDIPVGRLFLGLSGQVHLRTTTGSVKLEEAFAYSADYLEEFGSVFELLPEGATVIVSS